MVQSIDRACGISLRDLLFDAEFFGAKDIHVRSCSSDSRCVQPGDLFVAIPGVEYDGHDFVDQALARGATALLLERPLPVAGVPSCIVDEVRPAYGRLCQALSGNPSEQLKVIGVTGTNGKTTTSWLIAGVLKATGARVGTLGTLGIFADGRLAPPSLTTPPAAALAHWLSHMSAGDCSHAVMEVSSHALSQSRVAGVALDAVCITNIRRDHLDYHGTLENYRCAKARLLEHLSPEGIVILNADDPACMRLLPEIHGPVLTIGIEAEAEVTGRIVERRQSEQTFLLSAGSETAVVRTQMIGDHHVYNCLTAAALGLAYGIDLSTVVHGLESVVQVPGRMERIECGQPFGVYVDYAHTPDALTTCLKALRQVTEGRVICVFGAGGDRDPRKRPLMGAAVERLADLAVITTDNPRTEDPQSIAVEVRQGFNRPARVHQLLDRAEAIRWALGEARPGDSVLIAGKGHEDYQVVGSQRYSFDDRQLARDFLYQLSPEETSLWTRYA